MLNLIDQNIKFTKGKEHFELPGNNNYKVQI